MAVLKAWFTVSLPSINDVDTVFGKWTAPIWENMAYCRNWVTVKVKMIKIWRAWIGRFPVPNLVTV